MKKDINPSFYNNLWQNGVIQNPKNRFTWETVKGFEGERCLEIGCGNSPIIPLSNSCFLDLSQSAVDNLKLAGLRAFLGPADKIPFKNNSFKLIVAWHILEHVRYDQKAFSEISRVLKPGGSLLIAVPIWPEKWTEIDRIVGHKRRYLPEELIKTLKKNNLNVLRYREAKGSPCFLKTGIFAPLSVGVYKFVGQQGNSRFFQKLMNLWARLNFITEKIFSSPWKEGELQGLEKAEYLTLFCRKV